MRSSSTSAPEPRSSAQPGCSIRILPDQVATGWPAERLVPAIAGQPVAEALDKTLYGIAACYGSALTGQSAAGHLEMHKSSRGPTLALAAIFAVGGASADTADLIGKPIPNYYPQLTPTMIAINGTAAWSGIVQRFDPVTGSAVVFMPPPQIHVAGTARPI